jgi:predicted membrane protein (TIGR00267 family)
LRETLRKFKNYLRVTGADSISRRYFVMNSFDGALTMLGVIVGAWASGAVNPRVIIGIGLGASLAMGVSGFSGAYMAERAERKRRLDRLKRAMLTDLGKTMHGKASHFASIWTALVDGVSPFMAAVISMLPFFLASANLIPASGAAIISVILIMSMIFSLGIFLGRISRENMLLSGMRTLAAGILTAVITALVARI